MEIHLAFSLDTEYLFHFKIARELSASSTVGRIVGRRPTPTNFTWRYNIKHKKVKVCRPWTNGFVVERFNRTYVAEFFPKAFREKLYESVEALQRDLDLYLKFYNTERPHQRYRNMGKHPVETVEGFVKSSEKNAS